MIPSESITNIRETKEDDMLDEKDILHKENVCENRLRKCNVRKSYAYTKLAGHCLL